MDTSTKWLPHLAVSVFIFRLLIHLRKRGGKTSPGSLALDDPFSHERKHFQLARFLLTMTVGAQGWVRAHWLCGVYSKKETFDRNINHFWRGGAR